MKKKLPQLKKKFVSFLKEEDAQVIDKTASKIAIISSIASISFLVNIDDANAYGHSSCRHTNHTNAITDPLVNFEDQPIKKVIEHRGDSNCGRSKSWTREIQVPEKTVQSVHFNHNNYTKKS